MADNLTNWRSYPPSRPPIRYSRVPKIARPESLNHRKYYIHAIGVQSKTTDFLGLVFARSFRSLMTGRYQFSEFYV